MEHCNNYTVSIKGLYSFNCVTVYKMPQNKCLQPFDIRMKIILHYISVPCIIIIFFCYFIIMSCIIIIHHDIVNIMEYIFLNFVLPRLGKKKRKLNGHDKYLRKKNHSTCILYNNIEIGKNALHMKFVCSYFML